MIRTIDSGTIHSSRRVGLLHLGELARPLDAVALGQPAPRSWGRSTLRWASAMAEARSRPRTLNLIGM